MKLYLPLVSQFREKGLHEIQTVCSRLWHFDDVVADLNNYNEGFIEVCDIELESVILHPSSGH